MQKVSANDSASVRDIAMWLMETNAVTPSDSPVLAQEFSSLLDALESIANDSYNSSGSEGCTIKRRIERDNLDYIGIIEQENEEAEKMAKAAQERIHGEHEVGHEVVADVVQAVKSLPPLPLKAYTATETPKGADGQ